MPSESPMREPPITIVLNRIRFLASLLLLISVFDLRAMVDLNTNNMSDVWEKLRNATGVDPNLDSDGDGFPNILESIAGTDPFNPNSFPRIGAVSLSGTNFVMNVPSAPGKFYQLQSCPALGMGSLAWTNEASTIAQPGTTNVTFPMPANASGKFFRVFISDVDSDGDGLTDWEEYQLGLDPLNPN